VTSNEWLALGLFLVVVALTLYLTVWASRQTRLPSDRDTGGRGFSGFQNGLALGGDYLATAAFLGISGSIALYGYDGFTYAIGFLVGWLVALLLIAELLRNSGRTTVGDSLAFRMRQPGVRTAAAVSVVVSSICYLVALLVGARSLVGVLVPLDSELWLSSIVVAVSVLLIIFLTFGGLRGATWVQIVTTVVLGIGTLLVTVLVLWRFGFNLSALLGAAVDRSGKGEGFLVPGQLYGQGLVGTLDLWSTGLALVLGTAGLPHVLLRFTRTPTTVATRKSVLWAIGLIGGCSLLIFVLGFGAAAVISTRAGSLVAESAGNLASPLLAEAIGGGSASLSGPVLSALVSAVAFAAISAVVAGVTLTSASTVAYDLYLHVWRKGKASARSQRIVVLIAAMVIGAIAMALAIPAQRLNIAFLVALAFAVAASAHLPALLLNLFWRRFNTAGATASIYGGLIAALGLVIFSPVVSGTAQSLFPWLNLAWFPLRNPALISIPVGFACGIAGTLLSKDDSSQDRYDELSVRSLTGAGAERAVRP
jgi:cation/acetate symporter